MSRKFLVIAGALATPMAAQAVDFTISGHINRALVVVDTDDSPRVGVEDNGESSTRVRATGSTEIEGGTTVGIQFEYAGGDSFTLRDINSQPGRVFGIGHGADNVDYFGSLDAGPRTEMVRYDAPSVGPVSLGTGDRLSAQFALNTDLAGTSFGVKLAALQNGSVASTLGVSFGATMPSGIAISRAWAHGSDMVGSPGSPGRDAVEEEDEPSYTLAGAAVDFGMNTCPLPPICPPPPPPPPCPFPPPSASVGLHGQSVGCRQITDPSYVQLEIGYQLGKTAPMSWYEMDKASEGIGTRYTLQKVGADLLQTRHGTVTQENLALTHFAADLPYVFNHPGTGSPTRGLRISAGM